MTENKSKQKLTRTGGMPISDPVLTIIKKEPAVIEKVVSSLILESTIPSFHRRLMRPPKLQNREDDPLYALNNLDVRLARRIQDLGMDVTYSLSLALAVYSSITEFSNAMSSGVRATRPLMRLSHKLTNIPRVEKDSRAINRSADNMSLEFIKKHNPTDKRKPKIYLRDPNLGDNSKRLSKSDAKKLLREIEEATDLVDNIEHDEIILGEKAKGYLEGVDSKKPIDGLILRDKKFAFQLKEANNWKRVGSNTREANSKYIEVLKKTGRHSLEGEDSFIVHVSYKEGTIDDFNSWKNLKGHNGYEMVVEKLQQDAIVNQVVITLGDGTIIITFP